MGYQEAWVIISNKVILDFAIKGTNLEISDTGTAELLMRLWKPSACIFPELGGSGRVCVFVVKLQAGLDSE